MRELKRTAAALVALALCLGPSAAVPADPIVPKFECIELECPPHVRCSAGACVLMDCGSGACRFCPEEYKNLVIKSWCRYGCMKNSVRTGDAVLLLTKPFNTQVGPICL